MLRETVQLIPLTQENIKLIEHVEISESQTAFEGQKKHVDCLLDPIPGRKVEGFALAYESHIIGCFRLILPLEENICSLSAFAISKTFQGKGYGRASVQIIIDFVRSRYTQAMFLGLAVNPKNRVAVDLYLKSGFVFVKPELDGSHTYRYVY